MRHPQFSLQFFCLVATVLSLTACGHTSMTKTLWAAIPALGDDVDALPLHPQRIYLRVSVRGRTALMALGYRDSHPGGEVDTWYSSQGETLRLQNGRIVATTGLETDWRSVRYPQLPSWSEMIGLGKYEYRRERDEMPGYRYGISERVALRAIPAPSNSGLVGLAAKDLHWFEERVGGNGGNPPSRFAIHATMPRVVYVEHCLSASLCLALQEWPAVR